MNYHYIEFMIKERLKEEVEKLGQILQPWFFSYPSGARIRSMSHLLLWKLLNLHNNEGLVNSVSS
ncbi:MAG: hypothetical protein BA866_01290 [Desulfobulbaceae bacterium S5133MH15]|nr:MAG: hypothetical protein BA866_01290 [Desulfobulbaceae bacterium S5133MH15]